MLTKYYALKNPRNLPPSGRFIDPMNGEVFVPLPSETLTGMLTRVNDRRAVNLQSSLTLDDGTALLSAMLSETCSDVDRKEYFAPTTSMPTFSQAISVAKAVTHDMLRKNNTPVSSRQERARHCLKCPYHRKYKTMTVNPLAALPLSDNLTFPEESELGMCDLCGCPLSTKVKFSIDAILPEFYPEWLESIIRLLGKKAFDTCWILKESIKNPLLLSKLRATSQMMSPKDKEGALIEYLRDKDNGKF